MSILMLFFAVRWMTRIMHESNQAALRQEIHWLKKAAHWEIEEQKLLKKVVKLQKQIEKDGIKEGVKAGIRYYVKKDKKERVKGG